MKKNILKMFSVLLVLFTLLSLLCACGSDPSDETGETTEALQKKTGLLGSAGYGMTKTVDGITEYVDADGVTTVDVVPDAITVLKVESGDDSMFVGFDSRSVDLPEGCVLRAQVITSQAQPEEYDDLYGKMDGEIKVNGTPDGHEFVRIWIEDGEGQAITRYNGLAMVYVMTGEGRDVCGVCGVDDAEDEEIGYVICSTPVDGTPFEGRYAVLLLSHFSDAYAVFYED